MEYVVGVGREVCVGFNSGRFCRIYCSRMHGIVPPGLQHPSGGCTIPLQKEINLDKRLQLTLHPATSIFLEGYHFIQQFVTFAEVTG